MKVIKVGVVDNPDWKREMICTGRGNGDCGCGSTLLVERGDLFRTEFGIKGKIRLISTISKYDTFITFRCPVCGVNTDLDAKESEKFDYWRYMDRKEEKKEKKEKKDEEFISTFKIPFE